jgi:hypothetical protein
MARRNYKIARKGSRDTTAAIAAGLIILVFLIPSEAFSGYRIIADGNPLTTQCYWVQGSHLFLSENPKPIPLSRISSITPESFTPLETDLHQDAERRFFTYLSWMMERGAALVDRARINLDLLETIEDQRASPKGQSEYRALAGKSLSEISDLKKETEALLKAWATVRIPDRSLAVLGEIKSSQLLTVLMSLEERRVYLTSWDPTYLEYTFEHMEQALTFDESFSRIFRKLYGGQP